LFFRNGQNVREMMSVDISYEPTLGAGTPRRLFQGPMLNGARARYYDVTADGERFLVVERASDNVRRTVTEIHVVVNWFEELERLVPTDH